MWALLHALAASIVPDICPHISIECLSCELDAFRRECTKIDVENFRRVISNPEGWVAVEKRDHCAGLYRNGTISWLGPRNFARVFKVLFSATLVLGAHVFVCM
jgi:hypothetical protein